MAGRVPRHCIGPDEVCAQVITPGYEVTLEYNGEQYVYHTNQSGSSVRAARAEARSASQAQQGQTAGAVIGLRRDMDGACVDVRVDLQGVSFGACGSEMAASEFMTGTNRLEQLADMQRLYALVRRQHAGGQGDLRRQGHDRGYADRAAHDRRVGEPRGPRNPGRRPDRPIRHGVAPRGRDCGLLRRSCAWMRAATRPGPHARRPRLDKAWRQRGAGSPAAS